MPHNKKKSNKTTYNKINFIENLDELEVNTVKDISNYKDFKSLNIEDRLIILNIGLSSLIASLNNLHVIFKLITSLIFINLVIPNAIISRLN